MTFVGANATGWTELMNGTMITAVFTMYDLNFVNWTVAILFFIYQLMLYLKTRNPVMCWVTGLFFAALYIASEYVKTMSIQIIFVLLVFELAGILYILIWSK